MVTNHSLERDIPSDASLSADVTPTKGSVVADSESIGSTETHVFSNPAAAEYWRNKYEKAGYENRHRFDPEFQWTAEEEKRLVRRIDKKIMMWAWV